MSEVAEKSELHTASLPDGWRKTPLVELVSPDRPKIKPSDRPELAFIGMQHIESNTMTLLGTVPASEMKSNAVHFQPGDVLYGRLRPYLNKVFRPTFEGLCSAEFIVMPENDEIDGKYLQYFLNSARFVSFASHLKEGDRPRVNFKLLSSYKVPLPPTMEDQHRIVAEIEKQFSRLDKAVASLNRVKANLKRYKAAVLKAAVEGKLTEEWRKQNPSVEPASKLLERILAERPKLWEKMVTISNRQKKYVEPGPLAVGELPELPRKWEWVAADQVSDFITKGTTPNKAKLTADSGEVQFLKVYNLTFDGTLNRKYKPAFVSKKTHNKDLARSKVFTGDVLINIVGPPLGQVSVVPQNLGEANINQAIGRFRPVSPLSSEYLAMTLRATSVMGRAIRRAKTTAGQSNLTLAICRELPIPLPPEAEQRQILEEVERLLSVSNGLAREVSGALKRATRLRQSILSDAFNGAGLLPHIAISK